MLVAMCRDFVFCINFSTLFARWLEERMEHGENWADKDLPFNLGCNKCHPLNEGESEVGSVTWLLEGEMEASRISMHVIPVDCLMSNPLFHICVVTRE